MKWEEADKKLFHLRGRLKSQGFKVGIQDPLSSVIEGIASRGDERAGIIFEEAFRLGCRLDAWSEYFKRETWIELLQKHKKLVDEILSSKDPSQELPWSCIASGITDKYFKCELDKSCQSKMTLPCEKKCGNPCGVCGNENGIVENNTQSKVVPFNTSQKPDPATFRILFSFSKQGSAVFQPHLGLLEIFSMAFVRANIPVLYSQGFNPLPRLDIASPLSLGIKAGAEIATIDTEEFFAADKYKELLNAFLPDGLLIVESMNVLIPSGEKKHSVSSMLWGYMYAGKDGNPDMVKATEEKVYRASRTELGENVYGLERLSVLARPPKSVESPGVSYFEIYQTLYPRS
jgi:hypothetical protein